MADSLNEAVEKAVGEQEPEVPETEQQQESEIQQEQSTELTEVEIQQAKDLFKGLKSPETRTQIIDFLASQGGYSKAEAKEIVKEAAAATGKDKEETAKDILMSALGEEFAYLGDKLAPAIEKIIEKSTGKTKAEIEEIRQQNQLKEIETEVNIEFKKLAVTYYSDGKVPSDVETQMSKMMDLITPGADMSTADYLETVYFASLGKLGKSIPGKSAARTASQKLNQTRTPGEFNSAGRPTATAVNNQRMSLNDAVSKAAEELVKQGKVN